MIRRSLDPAAPYAAVYLTPNYGCRFQARLALATDSTSDSSVATPEQNAIRAPYWIKLERDGSHNSNGYSPADGVTGQPMSWTPQYIQMATDVYVGLALTSHKANEICKAQFSDVKITGAVTSAAWTNETIGIAMPDNDPEPMYALVQSGGQRAVVYHDDPKVSQTETWTQWNIDLTKFSS